METPAQRLVVDRVTFPGMAPREVIIFKSWLDLHKNEYDHFEYNVRIGNGTDPGPAYDQVTRDNYIVNTQKRIDAVGWQGTQPTIIEVKDRATGSCMSQLLTYKALWPNSFAHTPAPKLLLVTNRVAADMPQVLEASGIALQMVPADFSVLSPKLTPKGRT